MDHRKGLVVAISVFFLFALTGCGKDSSQESAALTSNSYKYRFNEGGCDTGWITASSFTQLCSDLESSSVNHYCDQSERADAFINQFGCPGTFQATP